MANKRKQRTSKRVEALTHDDTSRKNIPTAEYQTALAADDRSPIQVACERTNRDLDPQLVWRGKDMQDWAALVVPAPPLFIQENDFSKALRRPLAPECRDAGARGPVGVLCSRTSTAYQTTTPTPSSTNTTPTGRAEREDCRHIGSRCLTPPLPMV